ncbi:MAG: uracil phosphoribosyltransferase [Clostridia bacterium]|nr:uracil phosphoribosyltransferase [Clostridia bacterium]
MSTVHVVDHPLVQHKLTLMRQTDCSTKDFRQLLEEISMLMAYEVTRTLPLKEIEIDTPVAHCKSKIIAGKKLGIIPILRAGLGMVDGVMNIVPSAKVGHIGLYRDPETHKPVEYYCKLPADVDVRDLIVVDPMLATGGSAIAAIDFIKARGGKNITMMCLVGCPEGVKALQEAHPDVDLYIAAIDDHLNEHKYIVPGLGDAGDRLFGTK